MRHVFFSAISFSSWLQELSLACLVSHWRPMFTAKDPVHSPTPLQWKTASVAEIIGFPESELALFWSKDMGLYPNIMGGNQKQSVFIDELKGAIHTAEPQARGLVPTILRRGVFSSPTQWLSVPKQLQIKMLHTIHTCSYHIHIFN